MFDIIPQTMFAFIGGLGPAEIGIIVMLILLIWGGMKLPELTRSFGQSIGAFKQGKVQGEKEYQELQKELQERKENSN